MIPQGSYMRLLKEKKWTPRVVDFGMSLITSPRYWHIFGFNESTLTAKFATATAKKLRLFELTKKEADNG